MKKIFNNLLLLILILLQPISYYAQNVSIIQSTPYSMDVTWQAVVNNMGFTGTIYPQSYLNNTSFFSSCDVLIVSNGVATYTPTQINVILQFLQTGKPVYLQSEYQCTYTSNQGFLSLVSSLGGTFSWGGIVPGTLIPMTVLGSFATTNQSVPSLSYYWYGCNGIPSCNVIPFLEYNSTYHGFFFCPSNPSYGVLVTTTDQDWIQHHLSEDTALMENIITHMTTPSLRASSSAIQVSITGDTAICTGSSTTLTANATGTSPFTYSWAPGGSTVDSIMVNTAGTYTVTVTDNNGCVGKDSTTVTITPPPTPTASYNNPVCAGSMLNLSSSGGTSYTWTGPNGFASPQQNPSISNVTTSASGTYKVVVTNAAGCKDSTTINVTINPQPTASVSSNSPICVGQSLNLTSNGAGVGGSYNWSGPGSYSSSMQNPSIPAVSFSDSGVYQVIVTNASGCKDTTNTNVSIISCGVVQASFTVDKQTLCVGDCITFTDASSPASLPITSWMWIFNGGTPSTFNGQVPPCITYNTPGQYSVKLIVSDGTNTDDTLTNATFITVHPQPTASAAYNNPVCLGQSLNLTSNGAGVGGSYNWTGPNTYSSNSQNPIVSPTTANDSGNYQVIITDNFGCKDTTNINVLLNSLPIPDFSVTPACPGLPTQFSNSTPNLNNNTYTWDFGDGIGSSTQQNPNYSYTGGGTYTVQLIATSDSGCVDSISHTDTIPYLPVADFSIDTACFGDSTCFTDLSTVQNSTITGWTWSWGDGSPSGNTQNPCHLYSTQGTYNVIMTPTSAEGCVAANPAQHQAAFYPDPTADFSSSPVCFGFPTAFTDQSNVSSGNISTWNWNFGDGIGTSTQQNPTYTYTGNGTFNVTLAIGTNHNCVDTVTKQVTVNPNPVAGFYSNNNKGCTPWCVNFIDSSSISSGSITSWAWDLGNGNTSNNENAQACYTNEGLAVNNYTITLTVTSDKGCTDTETKTNYVSIYPRPKAAFTMTPNPGDVWHSKIYFMDESQGASVWAWNFGDGIGVSTAENPTYIYSDSGTYIITLNVANQWGCTDSTYGTERINPKYAVFIPNAFTPNYQDGHNDYFAVQGFGIKSVEMKIFNRWGNLIYSKSGQNPKWDGKYDDALVQPGVYVYKIVIMDANNKQHTYIGSVNVVR